MYKTIYIEKCQVVCQLLNFGLIPNQILVFKPRMQSAIFDQLFLVVHLYYFNCY